MRSERGQLGAGLIILMILGILAIGSFVVDSYHVQTVRNDLQQAVDAAALAGAQDLWFDIDKAESDAIRFAAFHKADGVRIVDGNPGVTVNVTVTAPGVTTPGKVEVVATRETRHMLAQLFGRKSDVITARAVAGTMGSIWLLDSGQLFPIAVSIDADPKAPGVTPLNTKKVGDTFTIYLEAKHWKNAAWTAFTSSKQGSYIKDAITDALKLTNHGAGFIPSVQVGQSINIINGNLGQHLITSVTVSTAMQTAPYIILPVIQGSAPFNQSAKVVGFIGLQVTGVKKNDDEPGAVDSITGILVKPEVSGESGPIPVTGNPINDQAIARLELTPIQLLE